MPKLKVPGVVLTSLWALFFSAHAKLRVKLNLGVSKMWAEKKCPRFNLVSVDILADGRRVFSFAVDRDLYRRDVSFRIAPWALFFLPTLNFELS